MGVPGWPPQTYPRPVWLLVPRWNLFVLHTGIGPSDLPPPIGPLTPAHDLCGYPSGLEGLGADAPEQSGKSLRDGMNVRLRGGIQVSVAQ